MYYEKDKDKIFQCKKKSEGGCEKKKNPCVTIKPPPDAKPTSAPLLLKDAEMENRKKETINNILTGIYETRLQYHNL